MEEEDGGEVLIPRRSVCPASFLSVRTDGRPAEGGLCVSLVLLCCANRLSL